jgi:hypothetical protein
VAVQIEQRVDVLVGDASLERFGLDEVGPARLLPLPSRLG